MYNAMSEKSNDFIDFPKRKKPNFIVRWLLKKYENIDDGSVPVQRTIGTLSAGSSSIDQPERAMQFTVYNASGGRVVETRRYDRLKDRSNSGLYIITNDQDFGKEIDKIITMEALK